MNIIKNTSYLIILLLALLASPYLMDAQIPKTEVVDLNNVKAIIKSDGTIFQDNGVGGFIISSEGPTQDVSLMNGVGLWISGKDPDGNLRGSVQVHNVDNKRDFIPSPGMNKIWRVNASEIEAHILDFEDNGFIDNPNSNIFSWPVKSNPFFEIFNESDISFHSELNHFGRFYDRDNDGIYNPGNGDYPMMNMPWCNDDPFPIPTEMLWFSFTDSIDHTQSQLLPLNMIVHCEIYVFSCLEDNPLNNTIIVNYRLQYRNYTDVFSTHIGVYSDFNIGDPENDFIGSSPDRGIMFSYNGSESDDEFDNEIPVMSMDVLHGPLDPISFNELEPSIFQSLGEVDELMGPQYYNLLKGLNPDGSPAANGGIAFPDDPNLPLGDSELAIGNVPGERQALASLGPFTLQPGAVNLVTVAYTFTGTPGQSTLENISDMYDQNNEIQSMFYDCSYSENCSQLVSNQQELNIANIDLFPNPTSDYVFIKMSKPMEMELSIVNLNGQVLYQQRSKEEVLKISVQDFVPGMYIVYIKMADGQKAKSKLVITN